MFKKAFKVMYLNHTEMQDSNNKLVQFLNDKSTGGIIDIQFRYVVESDQICYYIIYEILAEDDKKLSK